MSSQFCVVARRTRGGEAWLSPRTNQRLAVFERRVINGSIDAGLKVWIKLADGTVYSQPVRYKELKNGNLRLK